MTPRAFMQMMKGRMDKNKTKVPNDVRRAPGRTRLRLATPSEWGIAVVNPPEGHKRRRRDVLEKK